MARLPRLEIPGYPHLVLLRSRADRLPFADDEDRRAFCEALGFVVRRWSTALHAYALAQHSALLLMTPRDAGSLPGAMQQFNRRYVAAANARRRGLGPVWAGRYGAAVIDPQAWVLACMRVIDAEPVVQGLCDHASDWAWSSARHFAGIRTDSLLTVPEAYWTLGNTPFEREAAYRALLEAPAPVDRVRLIQQAGRGTPIGDTAFLDRIGKLTGRRFDRRTQGRPAAAIEPVPN